MAAIREAASSMANGIPSRRRQISTTAATSSALDTEKPGETACARSMNREIAAESMPAPTSSEGTGHSCSSASLSPSRLVATILTVAECARIASTKPAAASRTCSQLSNTSSRTLPSNAAATLSATLLPGCWMIPSTAATASGTAAGSATRLSQTTRPRPGIRRPAAPRLPALAGSCRPRPPRSTSPTDEPSPPLAARRVRTRVR